MENIRIRQDDGPVNQKLIADLAGVSPTTVANIIYGRRGKYSRKTKERVLNVMEECGYGGLQKRRNPHYHHIVVVLSIGYCSPKDYEDTATILRILYEQMKRRGYHMLVTMEEDQETIIYLEDFLPKAVLWIGKMAGEGLTRCMLEEIPVYEISSVVCTEEDAWEKKIVDALECLETIL